MEEQACHSGGITPQTVSSSSQPSRRQTRSTASSGSAGVSPSTPQTAASSCASTLSGTPSRLSFSTASAGVPRPSGWCDRFVQATGHYKGAVIWMAQDRPYAKSGSKQYRGFFSLPEFLDMAQFADEDYPSSYYELIPPSGAVYVYFDVDMKLASGSAYMEALASELEASTVAVAEALLGAFEEFLGTLTPNSIQLKPGVNCQVAGGSRQAQGDKPAKISLHFVCYIELDNVTTAKSVAVAFSNFIMNLPDTDVRKQQLTHAPRGVLEPIIDLAPYNKNQLFRLLYNAKAGNKASVRPLLGSSSSIGAHLIGVYDTTEAESTIDRATGSTYMTARSVISIAASFTSQLQPANVQPATPSASASMSRIPTSVARCIQSDATSKQMQPAWPPGYLRVGEEEDGVVEQALKANADLLSTLGVEHLAFRSKTLLKPHVCSLMVADRCQPRCPYAKKVHTSNHVSIIYDHQRRLVRVNCLDPDCKAEQRQHPVLFNFMPGAGDQSSTASLHDYAEEISWAESYASETMKPYAIDQGLVMGVVARMGVGKTKEMMNTMRSLSGKPMLVLTHRRALAKKYKCELDDCRTRLLQEADHEGLEGKDMPRFTCYLDVEGQLAAQHVIVCVNSALRVPLQRFGAVFIDEAVGVLSQLTSSILPDHGTIITHITNLLGCADRVYFLDAFADTTIVYEFATLIASLKGIPSVTWVRNQHIVKKPGSKRDTVMRLLESPSPDDRKAFEAAFLLNIITSLKAGRHIYVPCTTKTEAEVVACAVKMECPDITYQVYTSSTDQDAKDDAIANVNTAWEVVDIVIASNSLESGTSYEGSRFSEVIAWAQNCQEHGAPVFSIMQQLFRVRNLGPDGRMTLYVSGSREDQRAGSGKHQYPCNSAGVDCMLEAVHAGVLTYMPKPLVHGAQYCLRLPGTPAGDSSASCSSQQGQSSANKAGRGTLHHLCQTRSTDFLHLTSPSSSTMLLPVTICCEVAL